VTRLAEASCDANQALALRKFIAGSENHLLAQATDVVTHAWGRFNPLFVSGTSGVGKTHLLHCLADAATQSYRDLTKLTLPGADYARAVSDAIDVDTIDELRERHRRVDLFVLDGLHELVGKVAAQHELLNTIDCLTESGAMVIVGSRPSLDEMQYVVPLLASRLSNGLVIPLTQPAADTCAVILHELGRRGGVTIPQPLLDQFESPSGSHSNRWSVADLTAAVRALQNPDEHSTIAERLACQMTPRPPADAKQILKAVAKYFNVTLRDLTGNSRRQKVTRARALAAHLIRILHRTSLGEIGRCLGGRDHTTILHAIRRAKTLLETDHEFKRAESELLFVLE
jgi:chromosomal replication initiator protein